ncbi:hypothetical protein A5717_10345 [Mycolicibacterium porcinum]|uniref:hypothetical protein n=1 Tax=Mycolicibacterium porcinum TaxID=39693 RepID=UPI00080B5F4C|nr:hypothetical protein [Mycolicibacterium porcinum]OCB14531.1 hypothetical protein A5717_10345 [Mycolicibacterium porcinum]
MTVGRSLEFTGGELADIEGSFERIPVAGGVGVGGDAIDSGHLAEAVSPSRELLHHLLCGDDASGTLDGFNVELGGVVRDAAQNTVDRGLSG